ncbi:MAG: thrombospondin type 3 repeat-containing protein [Gammaproteobacteria bacterium]
MTLGFEAPVARYTGHGTDEWFVTIARVGKASQPPAFNASVAQVAPDSWLIDIADDDSLNRSSLAFSDSSVSVRSDLDGDGVWDDEDNCTLVANADQRDTNGDGYGNRCDADLDNDDKINFADLAIFRQAFGTTNADANFDSVGTVNFADLVILRSSFGKPPGPSGLHSR